MWAEHGFKALWPELDTKALCATLAIKAFWAELDTTRALCAAFAIEALLAELDTKALCAVLAIEALWAELDTRALWSALDCRTLSFPDQAEASAALYSSTSTCHLILEDDIILNLVYQLL